MRIGQVAGAAGVTVETLRFYELGGGGPTALDRVLEYGDGWFPQWHDADLFDRIRDLRARADRYLQVQVLSVPPEPKALAARPALCSAYLDAPALALVSTARPSAQFPECRALEERPRPRFHGNWAFASRPSANLHRKAP